MENKIIVLVGGKIAIETNVLSEILKSLDLKLEDLENEDNLNRVLVSVENLPDEQKMELQHSLCDEVEAKLNKAMEEFQSKMRDLQEDENIKNAAENFADIFKNFDDFFSNMKKKTNPDSNKKTKEKFFPKPDSKDIKG